MTTYNQLLKLLVEIKEHGKDIFIEHGLDPLLMVDNVEDDEQDTFFFIPVDKYGFHGEDESNVSKGKGVDETNGQRRNVVDGIRRIRRVNGNEIDVFIEPK